MGAIQAKAPLKGHDSASPEPDLGQRRPTPEDHASPEGPLEQQTHHRLARGSARGDGSRSTADEIDGNRHEEERQYRWQQRQLDSIEPHLYF